MENEKPPCKLEAGGFLIRCLQVKDELQQVGHPNC